MRAFKLTANGPVPIEADAPGVALGLHCAATPWEPLQCLQRYCPECRNVCPDCLKCRTRHCRCQAGE